MIVKTELPPLTGAAGEMADNIAAAKHGSDLLPLRGVIRMSNKFTDVEKTLLLTLAEERADEFHQAYMAGHVYPQS